MSKCIIFNTMEMKLNNYQKAVNSFVKNTYNTIEKIILINRNHFEF